MKLKYLFFSLALAPFLSSYVPLGSHSLQIGEEAPLITLSSSSKASTLDVLKGKFVVVNFWSPSNPESRILNKKLADLVSTLPPSQIQFVSICTDSDLSLQSEIMDADSLPQSVHYLSSSDVTYDVFEEFQTHTGCRTFLINPFGNLQSISPTLSEIRSVTV
ncbi:MAG: redoxin domain-containing protein [Bacteroides sp.]|nr:redoxin domain-containing protein [Bacteroides sp.]